MVSSSGLRTALHGEQACDIALVRISNCPREIGKNTFVSFLLESVSTNCICCGLLMVKGLGGGGSNSNYGPFIAADLEQGFQLPCGMW